MPAELVRKPVVFEPVADNGTTYRCTVSGPTHIVVERVGTSSEPPVRIAETK
jgi:hypothetical protein